MGRAGEKIAADFLRRRGFKILYRNFRGDRGAEIDLVCRDRAEDTLVFVEVKTRSSELFGNPAASVDRRKRRSIVRGATTWLRMLDFPEIVFRFDVVEVVLENPPTVRHFRAAFHLPDGYYL